ncbi:guanylate kinase [Nocardia sp. 004]|uniref:guanylate kinase n=1 Tax=Nocardia sp. 004 TaxID=3385978 RepID=UPI0039A14AB1
MTEHTRKGRLVVLVGPSAVGKSTVVRCARERLPDLVFSVSATTRAPRPGEVDGRDYHFVSRAQFDEMIEAGELLEWADIHGGLQRSGTPAGPVRAAMAQGRPVLVEVDLAGARSVRRAIPEAILVFLAPPSWDELVARLRARGTESPEVIERRLETARIELAACDEFDIVIVNSEVTSACEQLVSLFVSTNSSS